MSMILIGMAFNKLYMRWPKLTLQRYALKDVVGRALFTLDTPYRAKHMKRTPKDATWNLHMRGVHT